MLRGNLELADQWFAVTQIVHVRQKPGTGWIFVPWGLLACGRRCKRETRVRSLYWRGCDRCVKKQHADATEEDSQRTAEGLIARLATFFRGGDYVLVRHE